MVRLHLRDKVLAVLVVATLAACGVTASEPRGSGCGSDCGARGYCSPSPAICRSLAGYYCHTAGDLCVDDSDYPASNPGTTFPACVYSTTDSRWECDQLPVCF
jgi:hypothetical protein